MRWVGIGRGLEGAAHQPEQFAVAPPMLPPRDFGASGWENFLERRSCIGMTFKPKRNRIGVVQQALTPLLSGMHERGLGAVLLSVAFDCLLNCIGISVSHEPPDELHLSAPAFARPDAAGQSDRIDHPLADGQLQEPLIGELDQPLTQRLQRMAVALALRFAGGLCG